MSNEYRDYVFEQNMEMIEKYPFLQVRNRLTGRPDGYWMTWLDEFPEGWREGFGEQFCEDMLAAYNGLTKEQKDEFYFVQVKEKFGELRIYTTMYTYEILNVIHNYREKSRKTCIICGEPATRMTKGYVLPLCGECEIIF